MARKAKKKKNKQKDKKKSKMDGLAGKLRQVIDPAIAKALSHPTRSHILMRLGDCVASPKEIAEELGLEARDLDYHIKVLVELGMIRLVRKEKRRGAEEHFYELSPPLLEIDDGQWRRIPKEIQARFSAGLLQAVFDEAAEALRAGTFDARNSHQSRTAMLLDEEGWRELTGVMGDALEQVMAVRSKCESRRKEGSRPSIPVEVYMLGFETAAGALTSTDRTPPSS